MTQPPDEMTTEEQNIWANERRERLRQGSRSKASQVRRQRTLDGGRLDKLQAVAEKEKMGWALDWKGRPVPVPGVVATFADIREAIDAMPEIGEN